MNGSTAGTVEVELAGEAVELLPQRALYWRAEATLFVADLHLGKDGCFRAAGAPVPAGVMDETLVRLDDAVAATGAHRVVVLGDLTHAPIGLTDDMVDAVAAWRDRSGVSMALVDGNHDRKLRASGLADLAASWSMDLIDPGSRLGPFALQHEPATVVGAHALAGHLHPATIVRGGGDAVKAQAFWVRGGLGPGGVTVLPAFSVFVSGVPVRTKPGDRVWAVTPDRVIDLSSMPTGANGLGRSPAR
ncbi:MAG: ligase-associated DNA damage response endonuclease PdeM [Planctomycetota bacterium]